LRRPRLGNEGADVLGPELENRGFEQIGRARPVRFQRFVGTLVAIGIAGLDVRNAWRQQRRVGLAASRVAADRQRAERVAVVALQPRDDVAALGLAALHPVLALQLDRGLDGD
jgi:hypothetical protein